MIKEEESVWAKRREDWSPQKDDARTPYEVDYSRVMHAASFRRLQGKTQILSLGDGDFYRTRLTHSLEVAQIAVGIIQALQKKYAASTNIIDQLPNESLIQTICLNHDLGHPPFGHGGEVALNYCMRERGGFEGNGQSLRILSRLEKFSKEAGSNLTRRTLLGILKYPAPYSSLKSPDMKPRLAETTTVQIINRKSAKPPKCYLDSEQEVVDWLLKELDIEDKEKFLKISDHKIDEDGNKEHKKTIHKSFDCSIMDIADDIAYGVHDLEDAIALGLVSAEQFKSGVPETICGGFLDKLKERYPEESKNDVYEGFVKDLFSSGKERKRRIGRLVHHFITNIEVYEEKDFNEPLLKYRAKIADPHGKLLKSLKDFITDRVIKSPRVQHLEFKGQTMVVAVFETFASDAKSFLPSDIYELYEAAGKEGGMRVICDYVAGMTDDYLLKTYDRLFSPRMGSVFDKL